MGAPVLVELPDGMTDAINIALYEMEQDAVPITVVRRLPGQKKAALA